MLSRKKYTILWFFVVSLGLHGCMSNNFYVLSTASQPLTTYSYTKQVIGVEKITVPQYLFKREIAVAKSSSQITFLPNAVWAEDLDAGLTLRLISFLQKKFNQPNVYQYPWGLDKQPSKKLKVQISRFIAEDDTVYLDATWEVENMINHKIKARLFSTKVAMKQRNASSIVNAMDRAFSQLEDTIAKGLN